MTYCECTGHRGSTPTRCAAGALKAPQSRTTHVIRKFLALGGTEPRAVIVPPSLLTTASLEAFRPLAWFAGVLLAEDMLVRAARSARLRLGVASGSPIDRQLAGS